jgi:allantoinase
LDLIIEDVKLLQGDRLVTGSIGIEEGKIAWVGRRPPKTRGRTIKGKGMLAIPGVVDAHAHLYDPAFPSREDFRSGTRAAVAGGVTTVVEMVLQSPVDNAARVQAKIKVGQRNSLIDFALHAGMMNRSNLRNIGQLVRTGVSSFKTFTCSPYYVDEATLHDLMRETARYDATTVVHAEDEELANQNRARLETEGRRDPVAHAEWKPNEVERLAVERVVDTARHTSSRVHIAHMSTAEGFEIVREGKARGTKVSVETCPHYLTFTREDLRTHGPYLKMNPPLKGKEDVEALWSGLASGTVDIVASEHAPGEKSEKEEGWSNIWNAWGGVPSIETMLPIMISEGYWKRNLPLSRIIDALCARPARVFGLYPRKGVIQKGSDGDIVLVDTKRQRVVTSDRLHYKVGWTPYEGWTVKGWPSTTITRGHVAVRNDEIRNRPGFGKFLRMHLGT